MIGRGLKLVTVVEVPIPGMHRPINKAGDALTFLQPVSSLPHKMHKRIIESRVLGAALQGCKSCAKCSRFPKRKRIISVFLMFFPLLADLVLILHLAFVAFAAFGGLLVLRWPKILWLHLLALLWGVVVQWADWICPLTPLENAMRLRGGEAAYAGGFIERYVSQILYPENLTLELRYLLGIILIAVNVAVYAYVIATRTRSKPMQ